MRGEGQIGFIVGRVGQIHLALGHLQQEATEWVVGRGQLRAALGQRADGRPGDEREQPQQEQRPYQEQRPEAEGREQ